MIGVLGAGAFGTALAVALARGGKDVRLWGRDVSGIGREAPRLPGVVLPADLRVTGEIGVALEPAILLMALPMQATGAFLKAHAADLVGKTLVGCAKGFDLASGQGVTGLIAAEVPDAQAAILSGPSFAAEIGRGLPTALTLAGSEALQRALATPLLRLYRSDDPRGVEVGGALKNVIAIACGAAIGQGLGESARAALMTRGFAEMQRLGAAMGAQPETLLGLSGLGDLALTCTSDLSRNYRYGLALGRGEAFDPSITVEGAATARAATALAEREGIELPITEAVGRITGGQVSVGEAIQALLSRPLRSE